MRNNAWLESRLEHIWSTHFTDVERPNQILIRFGQKARTRLGSIRQASVASHQSPGKQEVANYKLQAASLITITAYFVDEIVPEYIVDLVIAHELAHYAHGFCSPLPQLYKNPHEGKIIDKELYRRGFGEEIKLQKIWLRTEWPKIIGPRTRITRRKTVKPTLKNIFKLLISN